mgnify:CR=1 FL=1
MRVAYLNNYLSLRGGSERVMFDEAALLRRRGHDVSFFSRRGPKDIEHEHAGFYLPNVVIEELHGWAKARRAFQVVYNPAMGRAFRKFLRAVRPQVLHAHNIYGGLTTAVLDVARAEGLPTVLTAHDYKLVCPSYRALARGKPCAACQGGRFYRCVLRRCHKDSLVASLVYAAETYFTIWGRKYAPVSHFLCPSRFMRDVLLANGYAPERVLYLPNAIDAAAIEPTPGQGDYVLYSGRLSPEKGLPTLLRAMVGLPLPLRIAGDGPLRAELERFVDGHGLRDRVTFTGHLAGPDLARQYREAAFVALPSEWYENAPVAALEAFAHGKPVVGSNLGGIPELVENGRTGRLFPAGDADALRECLAATWNDRAARGEMGAAARRRVVAEFSAERHAEALLELYGRILRKTSGP